MDYVNENVREVTIEIGQNKIVHRQYADYVETEAFIAEKFTTVTRTDNTTAREMLEKVNMLTNDEAGHLVAHMFSPNVGIDNYLSQYTDVNKKTIYAIETAQMDAIVKHDSFTHFTTRATLDSTGRPINYQAVADIFDRETGKHWLRFDGTMPNGEHRIFDRNPAKSEALPNSLDTTAKKLGGLKADALQRGATYMVQFDVSS